MQKYYKKYPWAKHCHKAKSRCKNDPHYIKRGIKFDMTQDDFKELWFRDKAWLFKKPTIDRIDSNGNYTKDNCRFIEWWENVTRDTPCKPIIQIDNEGHIIKRFRSTMLAVKTFGINYWSLKKVLMGRMNHVSGLQFIYANEEDR